MTLYTIQTHAGETHEVEAVEWECDDGRTVTFKDATGEAVAIYDVADVVQWSSCSPDPSWQEAWA